MQQLFKPIISSTKQEQIEDLKRSIVNKRMQHKTRNSIDRGTTISDKGVRNSFITLNRKA